MRIVELERRTEGIGRKIVDAAQRAHQADGREIGKSARIAGRGAPQPQSRDREACEMDTSRGDEEKRGGENRRCHRRIV